MKTNVIAAALLAVFSAGAFANPVGNVPGPEGTDGPGGLKPTGVKPTGVKPSGFPGFPGFPSGPGGPMPTGGLFPSGFPGLSGLPGGPGGPKPTGGLFPTGFPLGPGGPKPTHAAGPAARAEETPAPSGFQVRHKKKGGKHHSGTGAIPGVAKPTGGFGQHPGGPPKAKPQPAA
ncbi:hypothetical protein LX36DRAFT_58653 [Colletotrichum falcatum]|nr:hypothetical protein LX36DRAFT_58653 [Colletotrichum falcatum]